MKKSETLKHWSSLEPSNPLKYMVPIPYKASGSRYGACGIRIDGNPAFIDAVMSQLKPLLDGENHLTRLELARQKVDGSGIGKSLPNAGSNAEAGSFIRPLLAPDESRAPSKTPLPAYR